MLFSNSVLKFTQDQLFFLLSCIALIIILALNVFRGYLLTTPNPTVTDLQVQLSLFSTTSSIVDEVLIILTFARISFLHWNFKVLSINRANILVIAPIAIFHFFLLCPLHLLLLTECTYVATYLFAICYNIQLLVESVVVSGFAQKLHSTKKALKRAFPTGEDGKDGYGAALESHRRYSLIFQKYNERYGLLNLFNLIHTVVLVVVQANVILTYISNDHRPATLFRLFYMTLRTGVGFAKTATICIFCDSYQNAWVEYERELGSIHASYLYQGLLMRRTFWMSKFFAVDSKLLYKVTGVFTGLTTSINSLSFF